MVGFKLNSSAVPPNLVVRQVWHGLSLRAPAREGSKTSSEQGENEKPRRTCDGGGQILATQPIETQYLEFKVLHFGSPPSSGLFLWSPPHCATARPHDRRGNAGKT